MGATIKQLAEQFGVTKQTVVNRLKAIDMWEGHRSQVGNVFHIDDDACSAVAHELGKKYTPKPADEAAEANLPAPKPAPAAPDNSALLRALTDQVEFLKRQIELDREQHAAQLAEKDRQIKQLTDELARANDRVLEASNQVTAFAAAGIFQRLFGFKGLLTAPKDE